MEDRPSRFIWRDGDLKLVSSPYWIDARSRSVRAWVPIRPPFEPRPETIPWHFRAELRLAVSKLEKVSEDEIRGWQTFYVFLGLDLEARKRVSSGLGLDYAKRIAVYEEQIVDVTVGPLQIELADGNAVARREVQVIAVLNEPARLHQQGVNLLAGPGFRRGPAPGW